MRSTDIRTSYFCEAKKASAHSPGPRVGLRARGGRAAVSPCPSRIRHNAIVNLRQGMSRAPCLMLLRLSPRTDVSFLTGGGGIYWFTPTGTQSAGNGGWAGRGAPLDASRLMSKPGPEASSPRPIHAVPGKHGGDFAGDGWPMMLHPLDWDGRPDKGPSAD